MQRRGFIRSLIGGTAALAVAPVSTFRALAAETVTTPALTLAVIRETVGCIGEYSEYTNFSSFAIASAIDELVLDSASEFGYHAGQSIKNFEISA